MASSSRYSRNSPTVRLATALKTFLVEGFEDQPADFVVVGIDQRLCDDFSQRQIGQLALGGDALAFRSRGDAGELIAGLLLVGLGKQLAKIREDELLEIGDLRSVICNVNDLWFPHPTRKERG